MQGNWRTRPNEPHVIRGVGSSRPNTGRVDLSTVAGRSRKTAPKPTRKRRRR